MTTHFTHKKRWGLKLGILAAVLLLTAFSAAQTSSTLQLNIYEAVLDGHCVPADAPDAQGVSFQAAGHVLTIVGKNFNNSGTTPLVTLGGVQLTVNAWNDSFITAALECSTFLDGSFRLLVSTGVGQPYNDGITFSLSTRGLQGNKGDPGANGNDGIQGPKGDPGASGKDGINGTNGKDGVSGTNGKDGINGNNGKNGRGHRVDRVASTTCPNGGYTLLFYDIDENGLATLVDTKDICHGNNGANGNKGDKGDPGSNGRDGAPGLNGGQGPKGDQGNGGPQGPQGPPGYAYGWHKRFNSASISGTTSVVLSQVATGTPAYLIDAKLGAPFGNNAKTITCTLVAVENGVSTTLDSSDTLLLGNTQNTVKHDVSLAGVRCPTSPLT
jgi:hypothetical protein